MSKTKRINVKNILKVADAMEDAARPDAKPAIGYNQEAIVTSSGLPDRSGHNCGTVGCIIGWVNLVFPNRNPSQSAEEFLGLGRAQGDYLLPCHPPGSNDPDIHQAVRTLRHLAKTGEVRWNV